jgi:hypothetical protein
MAIVSPVKYTGLSVLSDRERYDVWKATLLGSVSPLNKVAFVIMGVAPFAEQLKVVAWHGATVEPIVNNPKTTIATKISRMNLTITLRLRNLRLF